MGMPMGASRNSVTLDCDVAQAQKFMDTGKSAMGLIAAVSFAMGMRYVSHFTIYGDLYEYGI